MLFSIAGCADFSMRHAAFGVVYVFLASTINPVKQEIEISQQLVSFSAVVAHSQELCGDIILPSDSLGESYLGKVQF